MGFGIWSENGNGSVLIFVIVWGFVWIWGFLIGVRNVGFSC